MRATQQHCRGDRDDAQGLRKLQMVSPLPLQTYWKNSGNRFYFSKLDPAVERLSGGGAGFTFPAASTVC